MQAPRRQVGVAVALALFAALALLNVPYTCDMCLLPSRDADLNLASCSYLVILQHMKDMHPKKASSLRVSSDNLALHTPSSHPSK